MSNLEQSVKSITVGSRILGRISKISYLPKRRHDKKKEKPHRERKMMPRGKTLMLEENNVHSSHTGMPNWIFLGSMEKKTQLGLSG